MARIASLDAALRTLCAENGWDFSIKLATGHECYWSAELRITIQPGNPDGPDRSYLTYSTGHQTPDAAYTAAWQAMKAWLAAQEELTTEQETRSS